MDYRGRYFPLGRSGSSNSPDRSVPSILLKNSKKGLLRSSPTLKSARMF